MVEPRRCLLTLVFLPPLAWLPATLLSSCTVTELTLLLRERVAVFLRAEARVREATDEDDDDDDDAEAEAGVVRRPSMS